MTRGGSSVDGSPLAKFDLQHGGAAAVCDHSLSPFLMEVNLIWPML
jgi:hypothetical protein